MSLLSGCHSLGPELEIFSLSLAIYQLTNNLTGEPPVLNSQSVGLRIVEIELALQTS